MSKLVEYIEKTYGVEYVGFYDIPTASSVYVFYQPYPETDKGHSNYLGVIRDWKDPGSILLIDAISILDAKYPAIRFDDGFILCSRSVHDYVTHGEAMLDGGLSYTRCNPHFPPNGHVVIRDGKEVFEEKVNAN